MKIEINAIHDPKTPNKLKETNRILNNNINDVRIEIQNKELSKVIKHKMKKLKKEQDISVLKYLQEFADIAMKTKVYDKLELVGLENNWILKLKQQNTLQWYQGRKGVNVDLQFFHLFKNLTKTRIGINYFPQVRNNKLKINEFKTIQSFSFPFLTETNSYYISLFSMQKFAFLTQGIDFRNEFKGIQISKNNHELSLYKKADEIGRVLRYFYQNKKILLDMKTKLQDSEFKHHNIVTRLIHNMNISKNPKLLFHFKNSFLLSYCDYKSSYDNAYTMSCFKDKDRSRFCFQSLQRIGSRVKIGDVWFHNDIFNQIELIKSNTKEQIINDTAGLMFHLHGYGLQAKMMLNILSLQTNNILCISAGWI